MPQQCNGCGIEVGKNFHLDHIIPKSRGGSLDHPNNLQILCSKCNFSKGTLTMEEWVRVPNAPCRNYWWWRVEDAPKGIIGSKKILAEKISKRLNTLNFVSKLEPPKPSPLRRCKGKNRRSHRGGRRNVNRIQ